MGEPGDREQCAAGVERPDYSCRFCNVRIHRGDSGCACSTFRDATLYASLCVDCADMLDMLTADTRLGRVHKALVHQADMAGRRSDDY